MGLTLSYQARRELLLQMVPRYREASASQKGALLDAHCHHHCPKAMGCLCRVNATPHQLKYLPGLALSPVAARQQHAHTSASDLAPLHQGSHPVDQRSW